MASGRPSYLYREMVCEKDPNVKLDESIAAISLRPVKKGLASGFPDLDSDMVSLTDERFKSKVVVIQIMGSWCPNCLDETAFLSEYYKKIKAGSGKCWRWLMNIPPIFSGEKKYFKIPAEYAVEYPMLITGVSSVDSFKTEKTLPQITPHKGFPFNDLYWKRREGKKVPYRVLWAGSGKYYEEFKKEFEETITELLKQ